MDLKNFDINKIRSEFPILEKEVYNRRLVYLDNAATTQKPQRVIDDILYSYTDANANVHRGVHFLSNLATDRMEQTRKRVAKFINAPSEREIIFTRGTTESINLVASSYGGAFLNEGDEILISTMEHHADIVTWQMIAEKKKAKLRVIPIDDKGEIILEEFEKLLNPKTKILAICHISNVLGTENPIKYMVKKAHELGAITLIDAAQSIAHSRVDVQDIDADFLVFSSHKIYGPTGIGVLYGKSKYLEAMPPYMGGGEMISKVTFEKTTYNEIPFKFEAGTPDYIGISALSKALDFVEELGIENIAIWEHKLLTYANKKLIETFDSRIKFLGESDNKSAIISFQLGDIHPFDLGTIIDRLGVAIRTGHHCAEPLLARYGYTAIARASFAVYNTMEEVDIFVASLKKAEAMLS